MKRAVLIHGWEGFPENHWFPWLREELEKEDFKVLIPAMPDTENPVINVWIDYLKGIVGEVDEDTYFIGHSIGCQTIMRFLEKEGKRVGGVIFVAGFFNLNHLETDEDKEIARPWLETPIEMERIKDNEIVAIFSDDDPDVDVSDSKLFEERLDAKIIIEQNKGHFCKGDGVSELSVVLDELLRISKKH